MFTSLRTPGFIAVSGQPRSVRELGALARASEEPVTFTAFGSIGVATWQLFGDPADERDGPVLLSSVARRRERELTRREVGATWDERGGRGLAEILPPFGALRRVGDRVEVVTDALGFRHVYYGTAGGTAAVSTSARAVAACLGVGLDRRGVAVQSLLGWQLDDRTLHRGVRKLPAGCRLVLDAGEVEVGSYTDVRPDEVTVDEAVPAAAAMLRQYLGAYLDDHPDALLQLTGGQDSRLLLSAVPERRRRGLQVMTLGEPDNPDVMIARELSERYGMKHRLVSVSGLQDLPPETAYDMCVAAAERLEAMADPIAFASLSWAESRVAQGPRLSGLGGEVARGFYYIGPSLRLPVTRPMASLLASWRMLANESVAAEVLDETFAARARKFTTAEIHRLLLASGQDWMAATDELYLWQRMQRWAGVTDSAVVFDRPVTNPMLDDRFIAIARGLRPSDKRSARFLSRVQVELDAELAHRPLEGRPAPVVYAQANVSGAFRLSAATAARFVRKARQRLRREHRPPMGGPVLAAKVVEHWRREPTTLDRVRELGIIRPGWIEDVLAGRAGADASTVALVVNLGVAASAGEEA